jgi:hypothetical protein
MSRRFTPRAPRNETIIKRIEVIGRRIKITRFDFANNSSTHSEFVAVIPPSFAHDHFILRYRPEESLIKTGWLCWKPMDEETHNALWREITGAVARQVNYLRGVLHDLNQQSKAPGK